ncbi:hypothetical protein HDV01_000987 [Terramyces sp. JEL0728]|nr:hypothetical protein HDV01_000987 [Terramyces sp. JEL0728]
MSVEEKFKALLECSPLEKKNDAMEGKIREFRNIDGIKNILDEERQCYAELKEKFIFDPRNVKDNLELNNPLSEDEENVWKQSFADSDLKTTIWQDVCRTFPENLRFHDPYVRSILENVLFVWCKMNPNISYRQGMHELVAIIFLVVERDATLYSELGECFDSKFIEADISILFFNLMRNFKNWYDVSPPSKEQPIMPIMQTCRNVMEYLKILDYELYRHITLLEVEPQLFGIRWFRLLFCREFELDSVLQIWDGLLADGSLAFAEWFAVSMLINSRTELLSSDYSLLMQKLMKFTPPQQSIPGQLSFASALRAKYQEHISSNSIKMIENSMNPDDKLTLEALSHLKESAVRVISVIEAVEQGSYTGPSLMVKVKSIQSEMQTALQNLNLYLDPTMKKSDSTTLKLPIAQTAEQIAGQLKAGLVEMNKAFQGFIVDSPNQVKK